MLVKIPYLTNGLAVASMLCVAALGQTPAPQEQPAQQPPAQQQAPPAGQPAAGEKPAGQPGQKNWKDRAEYDLFESIRTQTDNAKRLELLTQWKQKYPQTEFEQLRSQLMLSTYQALNQIPQGMEVAKEILAKDPKDITALSFITYFTPILNKTEQPALDAGEQAANGIIQNLDASFAADKKPANVDDAAWTKAKGESETLAHKTLGWVALQKKSYDAAETELKKTLELNPNSGEVSYWLGQTIAAMKKPERTGDAFYHFARAATYDGPGAIPPEGRKQIDQYLTDSYKRFHGSVEGLDALKTQAKTAAIPSGPVMVKSTADIQKEQMANEEKLKQDNPQLALWLGLKNTLISPEGQAYFDTNMKGTQLPKLKGKLVSATPPVKPTELVLALSDETTPEVTLKFETALPGKADPGTELQFEGLASAYTREPLMVTFDVESEKLEGWPVKATPAKPKPARRKPGAAKTSQR